MAQPPLPPEGLPEYIEPLRPLGEGGMGTVWSVCDKRTGKVGALKSVRTALLGDTQIVRRFEREIRTFAQLHHPYIVHVHDVGRLLNNAPYILMEEVAGCPLIDLPLEGRTLGELLRLFDRILAALAEAHARRIIHRDLKPDNVLVYEDPLGELIPKLMDFGLAMVALETQTATRLTADGMVVGTPAYMAPEQACDEHHKISPATDLYAFGCMLFELLCGFPPFPGNSPMAILLAQATKPPKPFEPLPTIPDAVRLAPVISRLLEKDPLNRYELAADLRTDLRKSGLLDSNDDTDALHIGSQGDTLLGNARPQFGLDDTPRRTPDASTPNTLPRFQRPTEAQQQVSVLNLREPPFVGRIQERHTIAHYVEDVRQAQQAAVCLVHGPAGIGKSRLVQWSSEDGESRGGLRYLHVSLQAAPSPPLAILLALFNHLLLKGLSDSQCEQALMRFFHTQDPHDWRVVEYMTLAARGNKEAATSSLNSAMGRLDLLVYAGLVELSRTRPLLLWLDDTHAVPTKQVQKLVYGICAKQSTQPIPLLLVVVDRAEANVPSDLELAIGKIDVAWIRKGIHLEALNTQDMHEITREGLQLSPRLATTVVHLAAGSPLLAVALARQWHAAGLLEATPDGYDSLGDPNELPVPDAVHAVVLKQLELAFAGLHQEQWRPLAELAVVLGKNFSLAQLNAGVAQIPTRLPLIPPETFIERALADGILNSSTDGAFEYVSGLMREGLIAMLSPERLADLHRAAARAKKHCPNTNPGALVDIANHLLAGRAWDDAYNAFFAAAQEAFGYGKLDEALALLETSKQAVAAKEGVCGPWDERVAAVWELELAIACEQRDVEAARERATWLDHAAQRMRSPLWAARTLLAKGRLSEEIGEFAETHRLASKAIEILDQVEDNDFDPHARLRTRIEVYLLLADIGQEHYATQALELAKTSQQRPHLAATQLSVAKNLIRRQQGEAAHLMLNQAVTSAIAEGNLRHEGEALLLLAKSEEQRGEALLAEKALNSAARCFESLGQMERLAAIHQDIAQLMRRQKRFEDAAVHEKWQRLLRN